MGNNARLSWVLAASAFVAATVALASASFSIDRVSGVYKFNVGNVPGRTPPMAEDILEIVKATPTTAYVRVHLEAWNGDICGIAGVARVEGQSLVYRTQTDDGLCALSVGFASGNAMLHDNGGVCKRNWCGVNASYEGISFPANSRRDIRYMKRLLASKEYRDAITELDKKK